jgi:Heavy-metal resistance protein CzcE
MENIMKPKLVALTMIAMTLGFMNLSASAARSSFKGEVVPLSGAVRTIKIDAKTKYVNVTGHETVRFETNGNAFAIRFANVLPQFDLNQLAPAGVLDHKVTVYVAPDPVYLQ